MGLGWLWKWKEGHPKLFEVVVSVLIGLTIEIALTVLQPPQLSIVRKAGDSAADRMIRMSDWFGANSERSPAFALIDIDDATWKDWGSRVVTPRDRIAELIQRIAKSDPLAIVLDVDLSYPDAAEAEKTLFRVLEHYPKDAQSGPPLLLVRALSRSSQDPRALPRERMTNFEEAVRSNSNILFAAPLFERDTDGQVRRWRLFTQSCRDNRPAVVPGSHLAAAALAREAIANPDKTVEAAKIWKSLEGRLAAFSPDNCDGPARVHHGTLVDATGPAKPIAISEVDASTRVLYRIEWRDDAVALGPRIRFGDAETPLVLVRPARSVVALDPAQPVPGLAGRIVVIGGSFADSGDWYQTPLGRMPGALVLINGIQALTVNGTPVEPDFPTRTLISLSIILFASVAAAFLRPVVAGGATALFILGVMLASLRAFQSGVVLDLAVPAVGAAFHDLSASFMKFVRDFRHEGLRWVLKKPEEKASVKEAELPSKPSSVEG